MRLAFFDAYPKLRRSAEREFFCRARRAIAKLGWDMSVVKTSDEVYDYDPDCVLTTHELLAKTTSYPSIGLMWNPPPFITPHPNRIMNVLSLDGCMPGSERMKSFLADMFWSTTKDCPISKDLIHPSCFATERPNLKMGSRSVFYAGIGWDGARHGDILRKLSSSIPMKIYGEQEHWKMVGQSYQGELPFNGTAVLDSLNDAGIALCFHRPEHRLWGVPSMRLFEAAAAGALIIADENPFAKENFGDAALYVDMTAPAEDVIEQTKAHIDWVNHNPKHVAEMVDQAHSIFVEKLCLEKLLEPLPQFLDEVKSVNRMTPDTASTPKIIVPQAETAVAQDVPTVQYIMRIGSRTVDTIERAVRSLAGQTYPNLALTFVQFDEVEDLSSLIARFESRFQFIDVVRIPEGSIRSTSLWSGLNAIREPLFANLDDDDALHPNHVATLVEQLNRNPFAKLAYAGTVLVEEEPAYDELPEGVQGPVAPSKQDRRLLRFFRTMNRERYGRFENHITSHSWVGRRELLDEKLLQDPLLEVTEDFFLLMQFLERTEPVFSFRATAEWYLRSQSKTNSTFSDENWRRCQDRLRMRTLFFSTVVAARDMDEVLDIKRVPVTSAFPRQSGPSGRATNPVMMAAPEPLPPEIRETLIPMARWVARQIFRVRLVTKGTRRLASQPLLWPRRIYNAGGLLVRQGPRTFFQRVVLYGRFETGQYHGDPVILKLDKNLPGPQPNGDKDKRVA